MKTSRVFIGALLLGVLLAAFGCEKRPTAWQPQTAPTLLAPTPLILTAEEQVWVRTFEAANQALAKNAAIPTPTKMWNMVDTETPGFWGDFQIVGTPDIYAIAGGFAWVGRVSGSGDLASRSLVVLEGDTTARFQQATFPQFSFRQTIAQITFRNGRLEFGFINNGGFFDGLKIIPGYKK